MGKSKTTTSGTSESTQQSTDTIDNVVTRDPFEASTEGILSILNQTQGLNRERALAPTDPRNIQAADLLTQLAQQGGGAANVGGQNFAADLFGQAGVGPDVLSQFAQGQFSLAQDPRFQQNVQNQQTSTADLIRRMAAGAGRGGSPAETGILARELGKIGLDATLGQENIDLTRQAGAAQTLGQQGLFGVDSLAGLNQASAFPAGLLQQAGNIQQGAEQTELNDLLERIKQQQGIVFPAAGLGGTTSQVGETTSQASGTGLSSGTQVNAANPVTQGINLLSALSGFVKPPAPIPS